MKPSELANHLRRMASAIENSKNPSKELVLRDLKKTVFKVAMDAKLIVKEFADDDMMAQNFMSGPSTWDSTRKSLEEALKTGKIHKSYDKYGFSENGKVTDEALLKEVIDLMK